MKTNKYFLILLVYTLIYIIIKAYFLLSFDGPIVMFDEVFYKENAYYLFYHKVYYDIIYPPFYSILLIPSFLFSDDFYLGMKFLNVVYSSTSIIIIWLISRRYLSEINSLAVGLITSLMPFQYIFPKFIMSENVFYPLFLLLSYFVLKSRDSKSINFVIIAGICMGSLLLTRYYAIILLVPCSAFYFFDKIENEKLNFKKNSFRLIIFLFCTFVTSLPFYIGFQAFSLPFAEKNINSIDIIPSKKEEFKKNLVSDFKKNDIASLDLINLIESIARDSNFEKLVKENHLFQHVNVIQNIEKNQKILNKKKVLTHNEEIKLFNSRIDIIKNIYHDKFLTTSEMQQSNNLQFIFGILSAFKHLHYIPIFVNLLYFLLLMLGFVSLFIITYTLFTTYIINNFELLFLNFQCFFIMMISFLYYSPESIATTYFMGRYIFYISPILLTISMISLEKYNKMNLKLFLFNTLVITFLFYLIYRTFIVKDILQLGDHFIGYMNAPDAYIFLLGGKKIFYIFFIGNLIILSSLFILKKNIRTLIMFLTVFSLEIYGYSQVKDFEYFKPDSRHLVSAFLESNNIKNYKIFNNSNYSNPLILHYLRFRNINNFQFVENYNLINSKDTEGLLLNKSKIILNDHRLISTDNSNFLYSLPIVYPNVLINLVDLFEVKNTDGYIDFPSPWGKSIQPIDYENIFATSETAIRFKFIIPNVESPILIFRYGFYPLSKNWNVSDGAYFELNMIYGNLKKKIFLSEANPKDENKLIAFNLKSYKGEEVTLEFKTYNLLGKHNLGDWLIWESPMLIDLRDNRIEKLNTSIFIISK
jgi:hypothetical protein